MSSREQRAVFAGLLIHALDAADLSKGEVADQLGIHRSTLYQWLRGDIAPGPDRCTELETILGLTPGELARHLGYTVGDVTPEAAIEADPHISDDVKRVLLAALAEARRTQPN